MSIVIKVYAWGNSRLGQCGVDSGDVLSPRKVKFPAGVTPISIACGWGHAAAVGSDGKVSHGQCRPVYQVPGGILVYGGAITTFSFSCHIKQKDLKKI